MSLDCVMLVEDTYDDQYLAKRVLKKACSGVEIVIAADGLEAIELLRDGGCEPDVILLDINMPRMNGLEFLESYASRNKRTPPIVVMLTSADQEPDRSKSLSYDCVFDYFLKPLCEKDILELAKFMKHQKVK